MTELYIGTTAGGTVAFSALATPVKEPAEFYYYPYAEINDTPGGTAVTRGAAYCEMIWDQIPRPQRDQLRTFCPGPSATVYVYIPKNDSNKTFGLFSGEMIWPLREKYSRGAASDILQDFTIKINKLVSA